MEPYPLPSDDEIRAAYDEGVEAVIKLGDQWRSKYAMAILS